jgi:hypothetical protein
VPRKILPDRVLGKRLTGIATCAAQRCESAHTRTRGDVRDGACLP